MIQKQLKKLVKEYELLRDQGDSDYPFQWSDLFERFDIGDSTTLMLKSKKVKELGLTLEEVRARAYLLVFYRRSRAVRNNLYYEAFKTGEMTILNNALYQSSVMEQLGNTLSPGIARSYYAYRVLPEMIASGRFSDVPKLMPLVEHQEDSKPLAFTQLFKSVFYDTQDYLNYSYDRLVKWQREDNTFLLALAHRDVERASAALVAICKSDKRSREWAETRFTRGFSVRGHAYYNLSQQVFGGALKGLIEKPKVDNFLMELAEWQEEHDFQLGTIFQPFPQHLEFANKVMKLDSPVMHLHRPYANQGGRESKLTILDTERYERELISLVVVLGGK